MHDSKFGLQNNDYKLIIDTLTFSFRLKDVSKLSTGSAYSCGGPWEATARAPNEALVASAEHGGGGWVPQDGGTPPGGEFGCGKVRVVDSAFICLLCSSNSNVHHLYFAAPKFSPWGSASVLGHPPTTSVLHGGHMSLIGSACRRLPRPATAHPGLALPTTHPGAALTSLVTPGPACGGL